jgi:regulator of replication initiation timing
MIDEKIGKEEKALDELIAQALQVDKLLEANALLAESVQTLSEENARLAKENASLRKIIRVLSSKHKE